MAASIRPRLVSAPSFECTCSRDPYCNCPVEIALPRLTWWRRALGVVTPPSAVLAVLFCDERFEVDLPSARVVR